MFLIMFSHDAFCSWSCSHLVHHVPDHVLTCYIMFLIMFSPDTSCSWSCSYLVHHVPDHVLTWYIMFLIMFSGNTLSPWSYRSWRSRSSLINNPYRHVSCDVFDHCQYVPWCTVVRIFPLPLPRRAVNTSKPLNIKPKKHLPSFSGSWLILTS